MFSDSINGWHFSCNSSFGTQSWSSGFWPPPLWRSQSLSAVVKIVELFCLIFSYVCQKKGYLFNDIGRIWLIYYYCLLVWWQHFNRWWEEYTKKYIKNTMKSFILEDYDISLCRLSTTQIYRRLKNYIFYVVCIFKSHRVEVSVIDQLIP